MRFRTYDPKFEIQVLAPTETGGRAHARVRDTIPAAVGHVAIENLSGQSLGVAEVGDGEKTARLIVIGDGLGRSGGQVYTPSVLVIPETSDRAPGI